MYKEIVQTLPLPTSWCCLMAAFMQQVDGWWWGEGQGLGLEKASRGRNPSFLLCSFFFSSKQPCAFSNG